MSAKRKDSTSEDYHDDEQAESGGIKQGKKKRLKIADLEDFISLDDVCSKCKRLKGLLDGQKERGVSQEQWKQAVTLLAGCGYIAHAKKFTKLSPKTNISQNYCLIDDISMERETRDYDTL